MRQWKAAWRAKKSASRRPADAHVYAYKRFLRSLRPLKPLPLQDAHVAEFRRVMKRREYDRARLAKPEWRRTKKARRKAAVERATPPWADDDKTRQWYDAAKLMTAVLGAQYQVDHLIPLRGRNVCGLHWHGNLCIRTLEENAKKGNSVGDCESIEYALHSPPKYESESHDQSSRFAEAEA